MSLYCPGCGQLNHVGLAHTCDSPSAAERLRRALRAERADQRAREPWFAPFVGVSYTVVPEPPRDMTPINVGRAYVGYPLAQIEAAGQTVIDGELA